MLLVLSCWTLLDAVGMGEHIFRIFEFGLGTSGCHADYPGNSKFWSFYVFQRESDVSFQLWVDKLTDHYQYCVSV